MQDRFQVISPVDGSIYLERSRPSEVEIEQALLDASKAKFPWKETAIEERISLCHKMLEYLLQNVSAISEEITWQMGRPIKYSPFEINGGLKERIEYMLNVAEASLSPLWVSNDEKGKRYITQEPLGIVLVLSPWNYPFLTSVNALIPALVAGNTVILKHADQVPLAAERYLAAAEYAGLPKGVFQILHASHDQVADIIRDPRIDFVSFTGSVKGGEAIEKNMAGTFLSSGFELGGKDPAYIRSDADLEKSIVNTADGAFFNSGQSCCAVERIYVDQSIYQEFVDGFVAETLKLKLGNPFNPEVTLGPMVRKSAADQVRHQVAEAIQHGARALIDDADFPMVDLSSAYLAPQVLIDVDHDMSIMQDETFAPVICIMSVSGDEEAIKYMNDSQYGLTASIWTQDAVRAIQIGQRLETGTCFMNRCDYLDPALAWSGVKKSGRGVTLSKFGYGQLTRTKSYHLRY